jgi:hypothetical protein
MHRPAHLGDESAVGPADLADEAGVEEEPLLRLGPVHEPSLHARVVVEPRREVILADAGRDQRARDLPAADGETELGRGFRGLEAGAGLEGRAREGKVPVVVGEPKLAPSRRVSFQQRASVVTPPSR